MNDTKAPSCVQLHVLVCGAGIAGLAAARAFKKCGHQVEVFERSKFTNEIGAAVTISPNGTRALRELDFDFKRGQGSNIQHLRMYHAVDFHIIFDEDFGDQEKLCGAPHEAMHRQDLHSELLRLALLEDDSQGSVAIHKGVKITKINIQNASLELDDGKIFSGDLLIGADGLHSDVQAAALGHRQVPIDTEWQIYRFLLPREKVMNDEIMKEMRVENARVMYDTPDPKKESLARFVWYECRNGEVQNFAAFYRGDEDQTKVEDFGNLADKNQVLKLFGHMHPKIVHTISQAEDILYWRVFERPALPSFVFGRTILIGDAAHAMTPFTAAGATQALEDAGALLSLFSKIGSEAELERRMQMYNKARYVRASRVQLGSIMPLKNGQPNPLTEMSKKFEDDDTDMPPKFKMMSSRDPQRSVYDWQFDIFKKCREILAEG